MDLGSIFYSVGIKADEASISKLNLIEEKISRIPDRKFVTISITGVEASMRKLSEDLEKFNTALDGSKKNVMSLADAIKDVYVKHGKSNAAEKELESIGSVAKKQTVLIEQLGGAIHGITNRNLDQFEGAFRRMQPTIDNNIKSYEMLRDVIVGMRNESGVKSTQAKSLEKQAEECELLIKYLKEINDLGGKSKTLNQFYESIRNSEVLPKSIKEAPENIAKEMAKAFGGEVNPETRKVIYNGMEKMAAMANSVIMKSGANMSPALKEAAKKWRDSFSRTDEFGLDNLTIKSMWIKRFEPMPGSMKELRDEIQRRMASYTESNPIKVNVIGELQGFNTGNKPKNPTPPNPGDQDVSKEQIKKELMESVKKLTDKKHVSNLDSALSGFSLDQQIIQIKKYISLLEKAKSLEEKYEKNLEDKYAMSLVMDFGNGKKKDLKTIEESLNTMEINLANKRLEAAREEVNYGKGDAVKAAEELSKAQEDYNKLVSKDAENKKAEESRKIDSMLKSMKSYNQSGLSSSNIAKIETSSNIASTKEMEFAANVAKETAEKIRKAFEFAAAGEKKDSPMQNFFNDVAAKCRRAEMAVDSFNKKLAEIPNGANPTQAIRDDFFKVIRDTSSIVSSSAKIRDAYDMKNNLDLSGANASFSVIADSMKLVIGDANKAAAAVEQVGESSKISAEKLKGMKEALKLESVDNQKLFSKSMIKGTIDSYALDDSPKKSALDDLKKYRDEMTKISESFKNLASTEGDPKAKKALEDMAKQADGSIKSIDALSAKISGLKDDSGILKLVSDFEKVGAKIDEVSTRSLRMEAVYKDWQMFSKGMVGIQGIGTDVSDSIHILVSKNESVMTAEVTKALGEYLHLFQALKNGTSDIDKARVALARLFALSGGDKLFESAIKQLDRSKKLSSSMQDKIIAKLNGTISSEYNTNSSFRNAIDEQKAAAKLMEEIRKVNLKINELEAKKEKLISSGKNVDELDRIINKYRIFVNLMNNSMTGEMNMSRMVSSRIKAISDSLASSVRIDNTLRGINSSPTTTTTERVVKTVENGNDYAKRYTRPGYDDTSYIAEQAKLSEQLRAEEEAAKKAKAAIDALSETQRKMALGSLDGRGIFSGVIDVTDVKRQVDALRDSVFKLMEEGKSIPEASRIASLKSISEESQKKIESASERIKSLKGELDAVPYPEYRAHFRSEIDKQLDLIESEKKKRDEANAALKSIGDPAVDLFNKAQARLEALINEYKTLSERLVKITEENNAVKSRIEQVQKVKDEILSLEKEFDKLKAKGSVKDSFGFYTDEAVKIIERRADAEERLRNITETLTEAQKVREKQKLADRTLESKIERGEENLMLGSVSKNLAFARNATGETIAALNELREVEKKFKELQNDGKTKNPDGSYTEEVIGLMNRRQKAVEKLLDSTETLEEAQKRRAKATKAASSSDKEAEKFQKEYDKEVQRRVKALKDLQKAHDDGDRKLKEYNSTLEKKVKLGFNVDEQAKAIQKLPDLLYRMRQSIKEGSTTPGELAKFKKEYKDIVSEIKRAGDRDAVKPRDLGVQWSLASNGVNQYSESMKGVLDKATSLNMVFGSLRTAIENAFTTFGLQQFLSNIINIGGELEKQQLAMGAILQDTAKANKIFDQVSELSMISPFDVQDLVKNTKLLSAFGIQYDDLYDTTRRLSDIAAALGVDFQRIAYEFGQTSARGWLDARELRMFANSGIPLLQKLSDLYTQERGETVSTANVRKMISNREVSFEDVKKVMWDMTNEGGNFFNMQQVMAESLAATWRNMLNEFNLMYGEIAKSGLGDWLKSVIKSITEFAKSWDTILVALGTYLGVATVAKTITSALSGAFGFMNSSTAKAALAEKQLNAALLEAQGRYGKLSAEQNLLIATKNRLAVADYRQLIAEGKLSGTRAARAVLDSRLIKSEKELLLLSLGLTKSQIASLMSVQKRTTTLGNILYGLNIRMKMLRVQARAFFAANLPTLVITAFAALTAYIVSSIRKANELKNKLEEIKGNYEVNVSTDATKLNTLVSSLKDVNLSQQERSDIISRINNQYGEYFDKLITEADSYDEIARAADRATESIKKKHAQDATGEMHSAIVKKYQEVVFENNVTGEELKKYFELSRTAKAGENIYRSEYEWNAIAKEINSAISEGINAKDIISGVKLKHGIDITEMFSEDAGWGASNAVSKTSKAYKAVLEMNERLNSLYEELGTTLYEDQFNEIDKFIESKRKKNPDDMDLQLRMDKLRADLINSLFSEGIIRLENGKYVNLIPEWQYAVNVVNGEDNPLKYSIQGLDNKYGFTPINNEYTRKADDDIKTIVEQLTSPWKTVIRDELSRGTILSFGKGVKNQIRTSFKYDPKSTELEYLEETAKKVEKLKKLQEQLNKLKEQQSNDPTKIWSNEEQSQLDGINAQLKIAEEIAKRLGINWEDFTSKSGKSKGEKFMKDVNNLRKAYEEYKKFYAQLGHEKGLSTWTETDRYKREFSNLKINDIIKFRETLERKYKQALARGLKEEASQISDIIVQFDLDVNQKSIDMSVSKVKDALQKMVDGFSFFESLMESGMSKSDASKIAFSNSYSENTSELLALSTKQLRDDVKSITNMSNELKLDEIVGNLMEMTDSDIISGFDGNGSAVLETLKRHLNRIKSGIADVNFESLGEYLKWKIESVFGRGINIDELRFLDAKGIQEYGEKNNVNIDAIQAQDLQSAISEYVKFKDELKKQIEQTYSEAYKDTESYMKERNGIIRKYDKLIAAERSGRNRQDIVDSLSLAKERKLAEKDLEEWKKIYQNYGLDNIVTKDYFSDLQKNIDIQKAGNDQTEVASINAKYDREALVRKFDNFKSGSGLKLVMDNLNSVSRSGMKYIEDHLEKISDEMKKLPTDKYEELLQIQEKLFSEKSKRKPFSSLFSALRDLSLYYKELETAKEALLKASIEKRNSDAKVYDAKSRYDEAVASYNTSGSSDDKMKMDAANIEYQNALKKNAEITMEVAKAEENRKKAELEISYAEKRLVAAVSGLKESFDSLGSSLNKLGSAIGGSYGEAFSLAGDLFSSYGEMYNGLKNVGSGGMSAFAGYIQFAASMISTSKKLSEAVHNIQYSTYEHYAKKQKEINDMVNAVNEYASAILNAKHAEENWFSSNTATNIKQASEDYYDAARAYRSAALAEQEVYQNKQSSGWGNYAVAGLAAAAAVVAAIYTGGAAAAAYGAIASSMVPVAAAAGATAATALSIGTATAMAALVSAGATLGVALAAGADALIQSFSYGEGMTAAMNNLVIETKKVDNGFWGIGWGGSNQKTQNLYDWLKEVGDMSKEYRETGKMSESSSLLAFGLKTQNQKLKEQFAKEAAKAGINDFELFDENGLVNIELVEALLANETLVSKLQGETKDTLELLKANAEKINEARESIREAVSEWYSPIVQNMTDGLWDWFDNGVNALDSFRKAATSTFRDIATSMIQSLMMNDIFDSYSEQLENATLLWGSGNMTNDEYVQMVAALTGDASSIYNDKLPMYEEMLSNIDEALGAYGISLKESDSSSMSSSISGMTEETADIMVAYINGIRGDLSMQRYIVESIGTEMLPHMSATADAQLAQLNIQTEYLRVISERVAGCEEHMDALRSDIHAVTLGDKSFSVS